MSRRREFSLRSSRISGGSSICCVSGEYCDSALRAMLDFSGAGGSVCGAVTRGGGRAGESGRDGQRGSPAAFVGLSGCFFCRCRRVSYLCGRRAAGGRAPAPGLTGGWAAPTALKSRSARLRNNSAPSGPRTSCADHCAAFGDFLGRLKAGAEHDTGDTCWNDHPQSSISRHHADAACASGRSGWGAWGARPCAGLRRPTKLPKTAQWSAWLV